MTLGAGILWSTVLVLLAAAIYQISVRKKWKLVGKTVAVLVLIGALAGGGFWGWFAYQNRPYVVEELAGIRLGMTPVEVKVAKGAPSTESEVGSREDETLSLLAWNYDDEYRSADIWVVFTGSNPESLRVSDICDLGSYDSLLGLGTFSTERDVVDRLGAPSSEEVDKGGLSKSIEYRQWNVTYKIAKGKVSHWCVRGAESIFFNDSPTNNASEPLQQSAVK